VSSQLPFTGPYLLAPMQGVTEPCFRDLVLERNTPDLLGGAFTEFARVTLNSIPTKSLLAHLGPNRFDQPVGLQLMGSDLEALAETAERISATTNAPLIDLNFGCPAKGAQRGCAGAALLEDPARIERIVAAVVHAAPSLPVTAKIRAGGENDRLLEDIARATEAGGAKLLTVHCRTRLEAYGDTADWGRLERAVNSVTIPVCGNGGIEIAADLPRMLNETGCTYAMVGRAALGDPWIFSGREVDQAEAARFLVLYARELSQRRSATPKGQAGRLKQLLNLWTAGGLVSDEAGHPRERLGWKRETDPLALIARLETIAGMPGLAAATKS
jgi:tRNA-dihydrouridine synthase